MVVVVVGCPGLATACDLHVVRLVDNRVEGGSSLRPQDGISDTRRGLTCDRAEVSLEEDLHQGGAGG